MELNDFLVLVKKELHARQGGVWMGYQEGEEGYRYCDYSAEGLMFRDWYCGRNPFAGERVVYRGGRLIWLMNYYGEMDETDIGRDDIFGFITAALIDVPDRMFCRGPKLFARGKFIYINHLEGEVGKFQGKETVIYGGKRVYELHYHGGLVSASESKNL